MTNCPGPGGGVSQRTVLVRVGGGGSHDELSWSGWGGSHDELSWSGWGGPTTNCPGPAGPEKSPTCGAVREKQQLSRIGPSDVIYSFQECTVEECGCSCIQTAVSFPLKTRLGAHSRDITLLRFQRN